MRETRRTWTNWPLLLGLSIILVRLLSLIGVPAALLLGPILAGILLAALDHPLAVPRPCFLVSQAIIGCLIARYLEPGLFATLARDWPVLIGTTLLTLGASFLLGYTLMRTGAVPGAAAIWGSAPGGAAPMVLLAEAYGADAQLVAVMTYMRVLVVVAVASIILTLVSGAPASLAGSVLFIKPVAFGTLAPTALVILGGLVLGLVLRLPAGPMLGAMAVGGIVEWLDLATIEIPPAALAAAYAFIGWRIGLTFSGEAVRRAARSLPWMVASSLVLVAFCSGLGALLAWWLDLDPVTAYLATSPGGIDSIAIMAISAHSDTPFVMALQSLRFLIALLLGPSVAAWLSRKTI